MKEKLRTKEHIGAELIKGSIKTDGVLKMQGSFCIEHYRDGKLLQTIKNINTIVDEGKNSILDIMFGAETQITEWYCGLIQDDNYTGIATADTMSSHAGWEEFTGYSNNRKQWEPDAASNQIITNSTPMEFAITSGNTLKGIFITSSATKGGTTGKLWSAGLFSSDLAVNISDTLRITYTLSM